MKTILITLVLSFFSFSILFSQNLINFTQKYKVQGKFGYGEIWGYKTHFKQADSCRLAFSSKTDTIRFWITNIISDEYFDVQTPNLPDNIGMYKLSVENSIDGVMNLPNALTVLDSARKTVMDLPMTLFRAEANSNTQFDGLTISLTNYDSAFYIQPGADTIRVDSILKVGGYLLNVNAYIPNNASPGYYDLFVYVNQDTLAIQRNLLFVSNPEKTQIDSISPDSIHNNKGNWTIYVYGKKTHFTNDSNVVINDLIKMLILGESVLDSVQVLNDTLLKFNIILPPPVKQVFKPNSTLYIYNPTDGLLSYPMQILLYGSIGDQQNNFDQVKLYPNPAKEQIWIESDEFMQDQLKVSVYSVSGAKVGEYNFSNQRRFQLPVSQLGNGVYFVYIQGQKKQKMLKFIKQ